MVRFPVGMLDVSSFVSSICDSSTSGRGGGTRSRGGRGGCFCCQVATESTISSFVGGVVKLCLCTPSQSTPAKTSKLSSVTMYQGIRTIFRFTC